MCASAAQSPGPPLRTPPRRRPGGLVGKGANALLFIFAAGADLSILTVCDFPKGLVCSERAAFIVVTKDTRCAKSQTLNSQRLRQPAVDTRVNAVLKGTSRRHPLRHARLALPNETMG